MEKSSRAAVGRGRRAATSKDAIALLKADHRQVEKWVKQFSKARVATRKSSLARQTCSALRVRTTIEEEIFWPTCLAATADEDLHHEAEVEHDGAKKLIAAIESTGPDNEYFDARVTVLSEMIKHPVKEEEQLRGMF